MHHRSLFIKRLWQMFWLMLFLVFHTTDGATKSAYNMMDGIDEIHHLKMETPHIYAIMGEDPYFVFSMDSFSSYSFAGLYMKITPGMNRECQYQLFWRGPEMEFSEQKSFRFDSDIQGSTSEFYISFGKYVDLESIAEFRVDVERCATGKIGFEEISLRTTTNIPDNVDAIIPHHMMMPVLPMEIKPHIWDKGPWSSHDMEAVAENRYRINQNDPYLISPPLNVPLNRTKGACFKLKYSGIDDQIKLQMFWSTYARGYSAKDSYIFWDTEKNETYEFVIPFTNLPQSEMLRTLRLDFPVCEGCVVELLDARLISKEFDEMTDLIPNLITYRLWNSVYDTYIPRDIVKRLGRDPIFVFFHILLLTIVSVMIVWLVITQKKQKTIPSRYG